MFDVPQTNITKYFDEASDFIEEAITANGMWGTPMATKLFVERKLEQIVIVIVRKDFYFSPFPLLAF